MAWWKKGASATPEGEEKLPKKEAKEEVQKTEETNNKPNWAQTPKKEASEEEKKTEVTPAKSNIAKTPAKEESKASDKNESVAAQVPEMSKWSSVEETKSTFSPSKTLPLLHTDSLDKVQLVRANSSFYKGLIVQNSNKVERDRIRALFDSHQALYTDPQFPPDQSSLAKNFSALSYSERKLYSSYQWKRASEIYNQPIKVFNNIDPNDILQGDLGDCYFLSTLSAIAEFPKRIEKLFDTQEYQPSGCYTVNICDMGIWTDYVIDDFFPYNSKKEKVAFSGPNIQSGISELWVLLIEKAWAKRFGSYKAIDSGLTQDALRDLTGGPCETLPVGDENLWEKVLSADQRDFIITASSSGDDGNGDAISEVGLVTLHAYSVIAAKEVTSRRGPEKILQIRNPWGSQEWQGAWSDNSDLWTPELKQALGWSNEDDGTFWMSFDDFSQYFSHVTICRIHDDFYYESLHYTQANNAFVVFKITVYDAGETYFISTQVDDRVFDANSGYTYSPTRMIVAKINENAGQDRLTYINAVGNYEDRDVWCSSDIEAGVYLVYIETNWIGNFTNQLAFSVYSAAPATIEDVTLQEPDFISQVYTCELAKKEVKPALLGPDIVLYNVNHSGEQSDGKIKEGFLFDAIENNSQDLVLEFEAHHKVLANVEILGEFAGADTYKVTLRPGEKKVVVKKQIDIAAEHTSVQFIKKKKLIPV